MKSSEFLPELVNLENFRDVEVTSIHTDSREVEKGGIFFAFKGNMLDGNKFISEAIDRGASLIISDTNDSTLPNLIYFRKLKKNIGIFASRFYGTPSEKIKTICVTGTNGKTTSVETLSGMSNLLGYRCAYMSTINFSKDGSSLEQSILTTPDPIRIHQNIAAAVECQSTFISMEASSHGLDQDRLKGVIIEYAILTSFSHDHLDYHGDIESYQAAKEKLFYDLSPKNNVICIDSPFGQKLYSDLIKINPKTYSVSIKQNADFHASFTQSSIGLKVHLKALDKKITFEVKTISRYLASNLICSIAVLILEGMDLSAISKIISEIKMPLGRLEKITKEDFSIYLDYAHTPAALKYTLKELKNIHKEPLWCLFGCGGDRDKDKRPIMGSIAEKFSDHVVLTSDNPRNEVEMDIINDILSGITNSDKVRINPNRKEAIELTFAEIKENIKGGVLLISGKGHEQYQEINGCFYNLNDRDIISAL